MEILSIISQEEFGKKILARPIGDGIIDSGNGNSGSGGDNGKGNNGNGKDKNGNNGNHGIKEDTEDSGNINEDVPNQEGTSGMSIDLSLYAAEVSDYLQKPQSMVKYTYDPVGNRLSMTNDDGVVNYKYNDADRLLTAGEVQYEYDKNGNLVRKFDNGKTTNYRYNARDLLTEVDNNNSSYVKYGYDALGRKVYREEAQVDLDKLTSLVNSSNSGSSDNSNGNSNNSNSNNNDNSNSNGNGNSNSNAGGNGNGNSNSNAGGNDNGNSNNNAGDNGNGNGKYNNPGQGNKYGIYKNSGSGENIEIPLNTEAERYQYLGQTTILNKEYSDKSSPYAEYYTANNQVVAQKMFGLHGQVTPGKEETLNTNGGLMYYQYDGGNSVTELTNGHGDVIEDYRYDAFGNIYTGITSLYNTTGYTGQDYDNVAGLVQMDARWYDPNIGRFTTQDSYMGDAYSSQSLNRYSYVMNNPVNMWDPTGHVPSWVGDNNHFEPSSDYKTGDAYYFIRSYSSSSDWSLIGQFTTDTQITYLYQASRSQSWDYTHIALYDGVVTTDPETGEILSYQYGGGNNTGTVTYTDTDYYYKEEVKTASEMAGKNAEYINNLAGDPPKDSDPPALSISTMQTNGGSKHLQDLFVNGRYLTEAEGVLADIQKTYGFTINTELDANTTYQLEMIYEQNVQYAKETITTSITNITSDFLSYPSDRGTNGGTVEKLIDTFGFSYDANQDIYISNVDAWQRYAGYHRLIDETSAIPFGMVIDCEPIKFEYDNKLYMIEMWKGQYDLSTGAEIGIYESIGEIFDTHIWKSGGNNDMLQMSYSLKKNGEEVFRREGKHWWLTGFKPGVFSNPKELTMDISITFKEVEMRDSFLEALKGIGYNKKQDKLSINGNTVSFIFSNTKTEQPLLNNPFLIIPTQIKNYGLVKTYNAVQAAVGVKNNSPSSIDKILEEIPGVNFIF